MDDSTFSNVPAIFPQILAKCQEIGFTMPSEMQIGALLRSLIASKLKSNILELGTGIGLSLAWMIEGMDTNSKISSIDNDPTLSSISKEFFGSDHRVKIICMDGSEFLKSYKGEFFDLIFADTWPGKYWDVELALSLLKKRRLLYH